MVNQDNCLGTSRVGGQSSLPAIESATRIGRLDDADARFHLRVVHKPSPPLHECPEPRTTGTYNYCRPFNLCSPSRRYLTVFSPEGRLYQVGKGLKSVNLQFIMLINPHRICIQGYIGVWTYSHCDPRQGYSSSNYTEESTRMFFSLLDSSHR